MAHEIHFQMGRGVMSKSFLVLFFKKELLPSFRNHQTSKPERSKPGGPQAATPAGSGEAPDCRRSSGT